MEKEKIKIALIQTDICWENTDRNLLKLAEKLGSLEKDTDLVILPEMFSTGFTMNASNLAEPMHSTTFQWMQKMARLYKTIIMGSIIIVDNDQYYNRLLWVEPSAYDYYDKRHLFRMMREDKFFKEGEQLLIKKLKDWCICPLVCYDLRFPVWSRNINLQYDILIFVANWPTARINSWDVLLNARAMENLSYSVGVNRIGKDGNGVSFSGHSSVYDPKGKRLLFMKDKDAIGYVTLYKSQLEDFRNKFPAHLDADNFEIKKTR